MTVFLDVMSVHMDLGAHALMLGSALRCTNWFELLEGGIGDIADAIEKKNLLMSDDGPTQKDAMFEFETKAFHYVKDSCLYHPPVHEVPIAHVCCRLH